MRPETYEHILHQVPSDVTREQLPRKKCAQRLVVRAKEGFEGGRIAVTNSSHPFGIRKLAHRIRHGGQYRGQHPR